MFLVRCVDEICDLFWNKSSRDRQREVAMGTSLRGIVCLLALLHGMSMCQGGLLAAQELGGQDGIYEYHCLLGLSEHEAGKGQLLTVLYLGGGLDSLATSSVFFVSASELGLLTLRNSRFAVVYSNNKLWSVDFRDYRSPVVVDSMEFSSGIIRYISCHPGTDDLFLCQAPAVDHSVYRLKLDGNGFFADYRAIPLFSSERPRKIEKNRAHTVEVVSTVWHTSGTLLAAYSSSEQAVLFMSFDEDKDRFTIIDRVDYSFPIAAIPRGVFVEEDLFITEAYYDDLKGGRILSFKISSDRSDGFYAYESSSWDMDSEVVQIEVRDAQGCALILSKTKGVGGVFGRLDYASVNKEDGQLLLRYSSDLKDGEPTGLVMDSEGFQAILSIRSREVLGMNNPSESKRGMLDLRTMDHREHRTQMSNFVFSMPANLYRIAQAR